VIWTQNFKILAANNFHDESIP